MSLIIFKGWRVFGVNLDRRTISRWLKEVGDSSHDVFRRGMLGRHSGRIYNRPGGRRHQASNSNGSEYPANDSGRLLKSAKSVSTKDSATFGTNEEYSKWLREGSGRMARRKMSDNALVEGGVKAQSMSRRWIKFKRGKQSVRSLNG